MKRKYLLTALLLLFYYLPGIAQSVAINTDGSTANASAIFDVKSTAKGMLIPRMTLVNRNAIASPATGLMIYQTDNGPGFYYYDGTSWVSITSSGNNLWLRSGTDIYNNNTGNVGIGTTTPLALLEVKDGAVLFDNTIGSTPVSGAGTRMMWVPAKGAFRAGAVSGTQWDDANIGQNSVAIGSDTKASGLYAVALGSGTIAGGDNGVAMGLGAQANALASTATGAYTSATANGATAMGAYTTATGKVSSANGYYVKAQSYADFAVGLYNDITVSPDLNNPNSLNRIFEIGNGTAGTPDNAMTVLQNGNVGIGTTTPKAFLQIKRGAVLFDSTVGSTPVSGAGTRMMWIPAKAAFRAGVANGNEWDDANIGQNSVATGSSNKASGNTSTAIGFGSVASGDYSTSIGFINTVTGPAAVSIGSQNSASGIYNTSIGHQNNAGGDTASVAMGYQNVTSGISSIAIGRVATSSGRYSNSLGFQIKSKSFAGFVTGMYNDSTNAADASAINNLNRIFQVGNGTADNARSNAMTILQSGNVGIGTTTPQALLNVRNGAVLFNGINGSTPVSGSGTRMMWIPAWGAFRAGAVIGTQWDDTNIGYYSIGLGYNTIASDDNSIAIGISTTASGRNSTAIGAYTLASGLGSTALGYSTIASGIYSTALGSIAKATGENSIAMGDSTIASGINSTAMGQQTIASGTSSTATGAFVKSKSYAGFATGLFNDSTNAANASGIDNLNRIFQVGNGTADNARSNAITVLQNGNTGIGTTSPSATLDVNGTTTTNGLQVSNGTVFTKMQSGSVTAGASATSQLTYSVTFPVAFAGTPKVFVTARNEPSSNYNDAFSVSIRSISNTGVSFNIQRIDSNSGWGQQLRIDWFAVE